MVGFQRSGPDCTFINTYVGDEKNVNCLAGWNHAKDIQDPDSGLVFFPEDCEKSNKAGDYNFSEQEGLNENQKKLMFAVVF